MHHWEALGERPTRWANVLVPAWQQRTIAAAADAVGGEPAQTGQQLPAAPYLPAGFCLLASAAAPSVVAAASRVIQLLNINLAQRRLLCCLSCGCVASSAVLGAGNSAAAIAVAVGAHALHECLTNKQLQGRAGQGGAGQRRGKGRLARGNFAYKRCTCNQALVTAGCRWPAEQACTGWAAMAWLAPDCQGTTHDPFPSLPSPSGAASRTPGQRQQISGGR